MPAGDVGAEVLAGDARRVPVDRDAAPPARARPWPARPGRPPARRGSSSARRCRPRAARPGAAPCRRASGCGPPFSISEAGTHEGTLTKKLSGRPSVARSSIRMPSAPSTLPISCGSTTTLVVPCGTTARANSPAAEHGALDVQVAVDQAGQHVRPGQVDLVRAAILADADDVALVDGDIGRVDLVGQDVDDPRVLQDEVRSLRPRAAMIRSRSAIVGSPQARTGSVRPARRAPEDTGGAASGRRYSASGQNRRASCQCGTPARRSMDVYLIVAQQLSRSNPGRLTPAYSLR